MYRRFAYVGAFLLVLLGILALTASEGSPVLSGEKSTLDTGAYSEDFLADMAGPFLFAAATTLAILLVLGAASPARGWAKAVALCLVGLGLPILLLVQSLLLINFLAAHVTSEGLIYFTASYFFHAGFDAGFAAVYVLFLLTLMLLVVVLAAAGYLLAPRRFARALLDRTNWAKNEAIHVAATLILLLSTGVLAYHLFRLVQGRDAVALQRLGFFAQNLAAVYYLLCVVLVLLMLTVAAHTFLLNWGTQMPFEGRRLTENIRTIVRVERILITAALGLNLLLLMGPTLPSKYTLSDSTVFGLSPRGFSYAAFLLLSPYAAYAITERRLMELLSRSTAAPRATPFTERALRLVLVHVVGLILILVTAAAAGWQPLVLMMTLSAWTASVMMVFALRVDSTGRMSRLAFNGDAGPPLFFAAVALTITTGFMLWGQGNTFEALYDSSTDTIVLDNPSYHGEDLLARLGAVGLIVGSFLLTLDLWLHAYGARRKFFHHYLSIFILTSLTILITFTVNVWTKGSGRGIGSAYAGFSFRAYYQEDSVAVAVLVIVVTAYLFYAIRRVMRPILDERRAPAQVVAVTIERFQHSR